MFTEGDKVTVLLVTAAVVSVHYIDKGRKNQPWGDPVQVTARTEDNMFTTLVDICLLKNRQSTKPGHAED